VGSMKGPSLRCVQHFCSPEQPSFVLPQRTPSIRVYTHTGIQGPELSLSLSSLLPAVPHAQNQQGPGDPLTQPPQRQNGRSFRVWWWTWPFLVLLFPLPSPCLSLLTSLCSHLLSLWTP
jgi:hypothetical protein